MRKVSFFFSLFIFGLLGANIVKAENIEYTGYINSYNYFHYFNKTSNGNYQVYDNNNKILTLYSPEKDVIYNYNCASAVKIGNEMLCYSYTKASDDDTLYLHNFTYYEDDPNGNRSFTKTDSNTYNIVYYGNSDEFGGYYLGAITNNSSDDSSMIVLDDNFDLVAQDSDFSKEVIGNFFQSIYNILMLIEEYLELYGEPVAASFGSEYYSFVFSGNTEEDNKYYLMTFNFSGEKVLETEISPLTSVAVTRANNGFYIVYLSATDVKFYLEKYDLNGNLLYSSNLSDLITSDLNITSYFVISGINVDEEEVVFSIYDSLELSTLQTNTANNKSLILRFALNYNIDTVTDGNGVIMVDEKGTYAEEKEMQVIPNDGYEIDDLVITDINGNKVEYSSDYKFSMPNSDVTITAKFKTLVTENEVDDDIQNPATGAVLPVGGLLGGMLLGLGIYKYSKKREKITKI